MEERKINADEFVQKLIFEEDDVTWQSIIYEMAREGRIDPWDIDVAVLAQEYLATIKKLKEMNFRLSGKVILAAAVLLKMKAERIGLEQLLILMNPDKYGPQEEEFDEFASAEEKHFTKAKLDTRIPLPRKRKVTIFELVEALKKAVEVDERRRERWESLRPPPVPHIEIKKIDIFGKIEEVFNKIKNIFTRFKKNIIGFDEIIPSKEKRDIVWTLIPLLHLANQGRVELEQQEHFGPIFIRTSEEELNRDLTKEEFEDETEDEKKIEKIPETEVESPKENKAKTSGGKKAAKKKP
jgi:segregation and condensation protein A